MQSFYAQKEDYVFVCLLYDAQEGVNNIYKAISTNPWLQEGYKFFSINNPPVGAIEKNDNYEYIVPQIRGTSRMHKRELYECENCTTHEEHLNYTHHILEYWTIQNSSLKAKDLYDVMIWQLLDEYPER